MNSQGFLLLNIICIAVFSLWYWRSRETASKGPTKLNLRAPDTEPTLIPAEPATNPGLVAKGDLSKGPREAKNLNVIFNYNGHSWDAYEVLGVPAGSSVPDVTAAYQKALRNSDPKSHGFLETAYKAIIHRF